MQSADVTATFCATLVDEWVSLGVRAAVIAPGSRSTPMALALVASPVIQTHVFHDERSAAFAALGAAKSSGVPVLVLCTSGTAAANFLPAVAEASHAEVPLLVLTADRPPELQGVGAPQTIDQKHLYGSAVRAYFDAGVPDDERSDGWPRLAQRAFRSATSERPGPTHVNLPFREPLVGAAGPLPQRSTSAPFAGGTFKPLGTETLAKLATRLRKKRGVIIAGARGIRLDSAERLSQALGWPIIADPTGGCRGDAASLVRHADAWLRDQELSARFTPESVLRFGALPASKVVNQWLRESGAEMTTVSRTPFLIDPDRTTSMHIVTDGERLCDDLCSLVDKSDGAWLKQWSSAEIVARGVMSRLLDNEPVLTEPGVARATIAALPNDSQIVVSSSMPIRDVEWYSGSCAHVTVLSNRGANGIDGVVSTAVGAALGTARTTALLIGDVAFLHDSNGLIRLADRGIDLRIVVVDNRGGGIFSFLPQRALLASEAFEKVFGTPHETDLSLLAQAHGVRVQSVMSSSQLRDALASRGPSIAIVRTGRDENVAHHDDIHRAVIEEVRQALTA